MATQEHSHHFLTFLQHLLAGLRTLVLWFGMSMKHTPEPWALEEGGDIVGANLEEVRSCFSFEPDQWSNEGYDIPRIVDCVNALAGVESPAEAIQAAKVALAYYASCAETGSLSLAGGETAERALRLLQPNTPTK